MSDPIDDYCEVLRDEFRGLPGEDELVAELEDHLRESAEALSRSTSDAAAAERQAIERFGDPESIARRVRNEQGLRREHEPVPVARWRFTVAELLLLIAALLAVGEVWLYWVPCVGADEPGANWEACLLAMDGSAPPDAATSGVRMSSLLVAALGWAVFAAGQPWRPSTRRVATAITVCTPLLAGYAALQLIPSLRHDPVGWNAFGWFFFNAIAFLAVLAVADDPLHPRHLPARLRLGQSARPIPPRSYRVRAGLLAVAAIGVGGMPLMLIDYGVQLGLSDLDWDTPPGTGYFSPVLVGGCALASALLGLRGRRNRSRSTRARRSPAPVVVPIAPTTPVGRAEP